MPDKRPNDAQLRFNARASNSKRYRNSHEKATQESMFTGFSRDFLSIHATLSYDGTWIIFPGTFVLIRALPMIALLQGFRTKDKFYFLPSPHLL